MGTGDESESSYERLVATLQRSEFWSPEQARKSDTSTAVRPYYIADVTKEVDEAHIVVIFIEEPDFEYRIRVSLRDENGAAQYWTVAGTYLNEFIMTQEYLNPELLIERGSHCLVVDGSNAVY